MKEETIKILIFLVDILLAIGGMLIIILIIIEIGTVGYQFTNLEYQNDTKVIVDVSFPIEIPTGTYISQEGVRMSMCPEEANKLLLTQGGIYVSQEGIVDILIK